MYIPLRLAMDLDFVILAPRLRELMWEKDRRDATPESLSMRYENSLYDDEINVRLGEKERNVKEKREKLDLY